VVYLSTSCAAVEAVSGTLFTTGAVGQEWQDR